MDTFLGFVISMVIIDGNNAFYNPNNCTYFRGEFDWHAIPTDVCVSYNNGITQFYAECLSKDRIQVTKWSVQGTNQYCNYSSNDGFFITDVYTANDDVYFNCDGNSNCGVEIHQIDGVSNCDVPVGAFNLEYYVLGICEPDTNVVSSNGDYVSYSCADSDTLVISVYGNDTTCNSDNLVYNVTVNDGDCIDFANGFANSWKFNTSLCSEYFSRDKNSTQPPTMETDVPTHKPSISPIIDVTKGIYNPNNCTYWRRKSFTHAFPVNHCINIANANTDYKAVCINDTLLELTTYVQLNSANYNATTSNCNNIGDDTKQLVSKELYYQNSFNNKFWFNCKGTFECDLYTNFIPNYDCSSEYIQTDTYYDGYVLGLCDFDNQLFGSNTDYNYVKYSCIDNDRIMVSNYNGDNKCNDGNKTESIIIGGNDTNDSCVDFKGSLSINNPWYIDVTNCKEYLFEPPMPDNDSSYIKGAGIAFAVLMVSMIMQ